MLKYRSRPLRRLFRLFVDDDARRDHEKNVTIRAGRSGYAEQPAEKLAKFGPRSFHGNHTAVDEQRVTIAQAGLLTHMHLAERLPGEAEALLFLAVVVASVPRSPHRGRDRRHGRLGPEDVCLHSDKAAICGHNGLEGHAQTGCNRFVLRLENRLAVVVGRYFDTRGEDFLIVEFERYDLAVKHREL